MDRKQIESLVTKILSTVLKCEVNSETSRKNTSQWDSLKHIEVIFAIEDELGFSFTEEELSQLDSVNHIVEKALERNAS